MAFKILLGPVLAPWLLASLVVFASPKRSLSAGVAKSIANGSFEQGDVQPAGWRLKGGASWRRGSAHSGECSLVGISRTETLICESELVTLEPGANYRVDAWVNCTSGEARVGVDFLDEQGRMLMRRSAPALRAIQGWR